MGIPTNFIVGMQTPNIDRLAEESIVLNAAYNQYAVCGPSRASFLTGRRPDTTMVHVNSEYWRDTGGNFSTIPQYFRENGYLSYGSGKVFHGNNNDNLYSWTENCFRSTTDDFWESDGMSWGMIEPEDYEETPLPCMQIRDYGIDKLRQVANEPSPFFIAIGFKRPHLPFKAPRVFYDMYPLEDMYLPQHQYVPDNLPEMAWSSWGDLKNYIDIADYNNSYNQTLPDSKTLELRRGYYASVSYVDYMIGEVLQELTALKLENTTAVLYTSDHGYHLGEHADWAKSTNFELDTRVPFMLKVPGLTTSKIVIDEYVELVDIFPTLVDVVGLNPLSLCPQNSTLIKECHEGRSILESMESGQWKDAAFSQFRRSNNMGYTIHTKEYSYSRWMPLRDGVIQDWDKVSAEEFYDLVADPDQTENVAGYPEYVDMQIEATERLKASWRAALP